MKFSGQFVRRVVNTAYNPNQPGSPYWIVEFKGPDGLKYVAVWFGTKACSIICLAAPMRQDLNITDWAAEVTEYLTLVVQDIKRQQEEAARPDAPEDEEPIISETHDLEGAASHHVEQPEPSASVHA